MARKPLVLKTFNIWDSGFGELYADSDADPFRPINVGFEVLRKRLNRDQLAAEWQRADGDLFKIEEGHRWEGMCGEWSQADRDAQRRFDVIERMATLPTVDWEKELGNDGNHDAE